MSDHSSTPTPAIDTPNAELATLLAGLVGGGQHGELESLARLCDANPDWAEPNAHLGWALAMQGRHEESVTRSRRFLELQPGDVETYWRIGDRLLNLGRWDEAEAAYQSALSYEPENGDASMGVRYIRHLRRQSQSSRRPQWDIPSIGLVEEKEWAAQTPYQTENIALNDREFERKQLRLRSLPPELYLESTLKCNFYCRTCSKGYGPYYAEDLRQDIFDRTREELFPSNVRISITGFGEPTLAANFDEILDAAIANRSRIHFVTNGSLLNFERLELLTRCPVNISISMDGATKETFESIRQGGNFDLVLEKLAMIKKLRDIHLSQFVSNFSFVFVAVQRNLPELPDIVRIAAKYGIGFVHVADYGFQGTDFDAESPRFEPEEANRCLREAAKVARELSVLLRLPPEYSLEASAELEDAKDGGPGVEASHAASHAPRRSWRLLPAPNRFPQRCKSPWSEPYIRTGGDVAPCCVWFGRTMGNMAANGFDAVWNGWRYRVLRWRIESTLPPEACRACNMAWGINAGNAGNVMAQEGAAVKAVYRTLSLARRVARRVRDGWHGMRRRVARRAAPAGPEPNYYQGRPIAKSGVASGER